LIKSFKYQIVYNALLPFQEEKKSKSG